MSDRSESVAFAFLRRALHKAILGEGESRVRHKMEG